MAIHVFGCPWPCQVKPLCHHHRRHLLKRPGRALPIEEVRIRDRVLWEDLIALQHHHQPFRLRIRQRRQQDAFYHAENRAVRPNSKRQREYRGCREPRRFAQHSQPDLQVLREISDPVHFAYVAAFLLRLFHSSEFTQRGRARLFSRQSLCRIFLSLSRNMVAQLVVQFLIQPLTPKKRTQVQPKRINPIFRAHPALLLSRRHSTPHRSS